MIEALYILILLLPLPILLNRWRGTGNIYKFVTGTSIYALYLGLLIGNLCFANKVEFTLIENILSIMFDEKIILSNIVHSTIGFISTVCLFLLGESYAFGKWVGYLVSPNGEIEYENKAGTKFPFIHQTANFFVPQIKNYKRYCQLALSIRGFYWWTPIMILLACVGLINWYVAVLNSIVLAVGFPIACELSKHIRVKWIELKFLIINENWHIQELIYGLIHFICLNLSIFLTLYLKG